MSIFHQLAAAAVTIVAVARLTRLIVFDTYPPAAWVRNKWRDFTGESDWSKLVDCPYCAAPYLAAGVLAWGYFTDWQVAWWAFCIWLSVSYLAAILVVFDGDE